ncbi:hypothetical protein FWK45_02380 [Histophilus somni]|uniref:Uncharacterized protein n=2 Tax=Histophilus somni TaxID=731 RepID=A0AAX2S4L3_HISSO|nr:hypothetical protein [Histophilus somni]ARU64425.1 hypothetical protein BTV18_02350 [Histophilus somni]ARU66213.1 hypothetical protein BTV19_02345 [Histophilus somni]ARU68086.1 hypothetical protein BTV16_02350 [Histophilus somni]ARU69967.1 hypothetical protein BTV20_02350 [Histophilus somni]ARU71842.1 hypothetical protein BTV17_02345 [Histophilus somni]
MFRLFKPPFEISTLEAWSKMSDDIAKVAILAVPVMLYSNYSLGFRIFNIVILSVIALVFLTTGRCLRLEIIKCSKEK